MLRRNRPESLSHFATIFHLEKHIFDIGTERSGLFLQFHLGLKPSLEGLWCNRLSGRYNPVEHEGFRVDQESKIRRIVPMEPWNLRNGRSYRNLNSMLVVEQGYFSNETDYAQSMNSRASSFGIGSRSNGSIDSVSCMNWISDMAEVIALKHLSFVKKHDWTCCRWQKTLERSMDRLPSSFIRLNISRIPSGTTGAGVSGRAGSWMVSDSLEEMDMESASLSWLSASLSKPQ